MHACEYLTFWMQDVYFKGEKLAIKTKIVKIIVVVKISTLTKTSQQYTRKGRYYISLGMWQRPFHVYKMFSQYGTVIHYRLIKRPKRGGKKIRSKYEQQKKPSETSSEILNSTHVTVLQRLLLNTDAAYSFMNLFICVLESSGFPIHAFMRIQPARHVTITTKML